MPPRRGRARPQAAGRPGITGASRPGVAGPSRPGIAGASRVLIDGRNVQHALARERGGSTGVPLPTIALIARLRAAFSPPIEVELILDGHPGGSVSGRIAPAFSVTYSRHATADQVIGDRVAEALRALGPAGAWSVIVVTDDREVRDHARRNGARVEGTAWLGERLGGSGSGAGGSRRAGTTIGRSG